MLITGALGFVGSHVAHKLTSKGYRVVGLIREGADSAIPLEWGCVAWTTLGELTAFLDSKSLFAIVHLATNYGRGGNLCDVLESNVQMPLRLLDQCVRSNCAIFLSADTFFGKRQFNCPHMKTYIYSKNDFSNWAKLFCEVHPPIKVCNLRLEHVYGGGDGPQKFIPDIISRLRKNQPVIQLTKGDQLRDFLYVEDAADAFATILERYDQLPLGFVEYEVGTGSTTSIREIAEALHRLIGSQSKFDFGALPHRSNEIMVSKALPELLATYGWRASTPLFEGLSRTLNALL